MLAKFEKCHWRHLVDNFVATESGTNWWSYLSICQIGQIWLMKQLKSVLPQKSFRILISLEEKSPAGIVIGAQCDPDRLDCQQGEGAVLCLSLSYRHIFSCPDTVWGQLKTWLCHSLSHYFDLGTHRDILDTCDLWDIWSEWWENTICPKKRKR